MEIMLDEKNGVVYVKPHAPLTVEDFKQFASIIDPYISLHGYLKGLVIETPKFPGWDSIKAFKAHINFIHQHQAKVKKIALVTDFKFAIIFQHIVGLFIKPEIKRFSYDKKELAQQWILQ